MSCFYFRFWILLEHPTKDTEAIARTTTEPSTPNQSISSKISYIPTLLKFMIPLGLVYFFEYLINQGLVSAYNR